MGRTDHSLWPDPKHLGLITDLYQLTMMAGYAMSGQADRTATFELFVRRLPRDRNYLVFAGLEQAIEDLMRLSISREQARELRGWPVFQGIPDTWFDALPDLRFRGDVWAVPEGSVVFEGEPLLRVTARLPEAQWVETFLIASLSYTTLVASKAARIVEAARGKSLLEFGARRGHGPQSGLLCARASYLAGFDGTSHVEASRRLGIPCSGTMAHSWVQSFDSEREAFEAFARAFPGNSTVLVDTFDVPAAVELAATIEPPIRGIRLDSGDLLKLSRQSREILDRAGRTDVKIVASGDLEEQRIGALLEAGAPIDAFGVGTELITSRDAPALSMVYKLVAIDGHGRVKLSPGKATYPGAKQVYRERDGEGRFQRDVVALDDVNLIGERLLEPVVRGGELVSRLPSLEEARAHCDEQRRALPDRLRAIDREEEYEVEYSMRLKEAAARLGRVHD